MSKAANALPEQPDSWTWPEETWRPIIEKIRAGRSLKPETWPGGARCAEACQDRSLWATDVAFL
jgi:hypothetical protein